MPVYTLSYQHFCDEKYTGKLCEVLNKHGEAVLPGDLPAAFQGKFDTPGSFIIDTFFKVGLNSLIQQRIDRLQGEYNVTFDFNHAGHISEKRVIGCLKDTDVFVNINRQ